MSAFTEMSLSGTLPSLMMRDSPQQLSRPAPSGRVKAPSMNRVPMLTLGKSWRQPPWVMQEWRQRGRRQSPAREIFRVSLRFLVLFFVGTKVLRFSRGSRARTRSGNRWSSPEARDNSAKSVQTNRAVLANAPCRGFVRAVAGSRSALRPRAGQRYGAEVLLRIASSMGSAPSGQSGKVPGKSRGREGRWPGGTSIAWRGATGSAICLALFDWVKDIGRTMIQSMMP